MQTMTAQQNTKKKGRVSQSRLNGKVTVEFVPAVNEDRYLRLGISGPSGSGKTFTALQLARELVPDGRIALIDTERGSSVKYADIFEFDVARMSPPYHPDKFMAAIFAAKEQGYDVVIIDSLSHAWSGEGGVLEIVDKAQTRYNQNRWAAWSEGTPLHMELLDAITGTEMHIICTMRSRTRWILVEDDKGRNKPVKVGLEPVQRDGIDYEFDIMLQMDANNTAVVDKTRCSELNETVWEKPGAKLAEALAGWLSLGKPDEENPEDPKPVVSAGENGDRVAEIKAELDAVIAEYEAEYGDGEGEDGDKIPFELADKHKEEG
jgi:hypothetical protein